MISHYTDEQKIALLSLYFAKGVGAATQRQILENWENQKQWPDWQSIQKDFSSVLEQVAQPNLRKRAEQEKKWLQQNGAQVVSIFDSQYPPLLKSAYQAPPILFYRGKPVDWEKLVPIAFVGTREASEYGQKVVEDFVAGLAGLPVVIVSGFAKGMDTFAHEAALKAKLPTVGVLGTGLDYIYPSENKNLYYRMIEGGGLFSQFPTTTEPKPWNFPERNRIISGISKAVIVIEAPEKSGSLITAAFALEEGREVMAVPGNIFSMRHRGCHRLIQQGAKLITSVTDLIEELGFSSKNIQKELPLAPRPPLNLSADEKQLMDCLGSTPLHIDKITEISNFPFSQVASLLTELEMKDWVKEHPGKFFSKSESES